MQNPQLGSSGTENNDHDGEAGGLMGSPDMTAIVSALANQQNQVEET